MPPKKEYQNFLANFVQNAKQLTDEERLEIRIQKTMNDNLMSPKEKKDKVAILVHEYEQRK